MYWYTVWICEQTGPIRPIRPDALMISRLRFGVGVAWSPTKTLSVERKCLRVFV